MGDGGVDERLGIESRSRVQLRAVLAGLAVTAGVLAVCLGLSWAIGLSMFRPTAKQARGLVLANTIWGAVALWGCLFAGAYAAARAARSVEARDGIMHGLVIWGVLAATFGLFLLRAFAQLLNGMLVLTVSETGSARLPLASAAALERFAHIAAITVWLYWAGIVGGLVTAVLGGRLGARSSEKAPRRRARAEPAVATGPIAPQPA